nr:MULTISPECIES: LON peptidase substrate-binding domain-containing protein [unclassified Psychrosphaera]
MEININILRCAVFPLSVYLLPGGITKLKIFEQRYIRMVKESMQSGFVLSLYKPDLVHESSPWGVHVSIVDFEMLPDGLLGIVIKANNLVELTNMELEHDGLRCATISVLEHWPERDEDQYSQRLAAQLQQLMTQNKQYGSLYQNALFDAAPQWHNPVWVNQRWLEILPISYQHRAKFIQSSTFDVAQNFIQTMVLGLQNSPTIKI